MTDRMGGHFYQLKMKELEEQLGIKLPCIFHLGQRISIYIMEILQIYIEFIKELGMWNFDVFNKIFSFNLHYLH